MIGRGSRLPRVSYRLSIAVVCPELKPRRFGLEIFAGVGISILGLDGAHATIKSPLKEIVRI